VTLIPFGKAGVLVTFAIGDLVSNFIINRFSVSQYCSEFSFNLCMRKHMPRTQVAICSSLVRKWLCDESNAKDTL